MRRLSRVAVTIALIALATSVVSCGRENGPGVAPKGPVAKNIILMISDGAGHNAFRMASYYRHGELGREVYDAFPVSLSCSTYNVNRRGTTYGYDSAKRWGDFNWSKSAWTDSAAAATALYTGVKSYDCAIAVDINSAPLVTIAEMAKAEGRSVGDVTTVPLSHATPAAWAAHNVNRQNYAEIARDLIGGDTLDVLMGCGSPEDDVTGEPYTANLPHDAKYVGGDTTWADLKAGTAGGKRPWTLIRDRGDFEALAAGTRSPSRVIGIPRTYKTLQQERPGNAMAEPYAEPMNPNVPDLATMTRGALNVLSKNPKGFVLMVEGGAVDWANHVHQGGRMIEEQVDFNKAVEAVVAWVETNSSWDETLVIVTSDHECGALYGPDAGPTGKDPFQAVVNLGKGKVPAHKYFWHEHTNALVPLFAKGRGAERFFSHVRGSDPVDGDYVDNTDVFRVMKAALTGR